MSDCTIKPKSYINNILFVTIVYLIEFVYFIDYVHADRGARRETGIHFAVESGNVERVNEYIEFDSDYLYKINQIGLAPIHIAALNGDLAMVKLLVEKGCDLNLKSTSSNTPLHISSISGNTAVSEYLVSKGAKVDEKGEKGKTPLQIACKYQSKSIIETLVKYGADTKVLDKNGKTLLHIAAGHFKPDIVQFLIENGADVNAVDADGNTPYDEALLSKTRGLDRLFKIVETIKQILHDNGGQPMSTKK